MSQRYNNYRTKQYIQFDVSGDRRFTMQANVVEIRHTSDGVFGLVKSLDWRFTTIELPAPVPVKYARCSEWYPVDATTGQRVRYSHPHVEERYQAWLKLARERVEKRKATLLYGDITKAVREGK